MRFVFIHTLWLSLLLSAALLAVEPEPGSETEVEVVAAQLEAVTAEQPLQEPVLEAIEPVSAKEATSSPYRFGQDRAGGDQTLSRAGASSGLSLGKIVISLAFVILLVLMLGWAFKKLTLRIPGSQHMKVISTIPLGPKERLLVIEIQGKQRVLGVTSQQINFLFELNEPLPEEKLASEFHSQLQSWLKK
ncbi:flagellar biosynthetic protein FliO [Alkalimonas amylolytica]|uniref:Flagellar protein n=1 Tax=Alkalimonas amylolytica TaxID=152573 RepID=A0A1H4BMY9_ALKAM|nr:flagellar biosynthetic protein FliO [Alkalimonas amylolytica]